MKGIRTIASMTTPSLASAVKLGAGAIRRSHKSLISLSSKVLDSIDLDEALKDFFPADPRWDYAIAINCKGGTKVFFIEVHDASSPKAAVAIQSKLTWLQGWLKSGGRPFTKFSLKFCWVASGRISIPPNAREILRLATLGLPPPKSHIKIGCEK